MNDSSPDCVQLAVARLDWALRHVENFEREADQFLSLKPYAVIGHVEKNGKSTIRVSYRFKARMNPPASLRFAAGDAIHNLRAVVDNLFWRVVKISGAHDSLGLTFRDSAEDFDKAMRGKKFDKLPAPVQAWYQNEQVYNRADRPIRSLLNTLNNLWNMDKHRSPTILGNVSNFMGIGGYGPVRFRSFEQRSTSSLKDGAEIAVLVIPADQIVNFKADFGFDVSLEDGVLSARRFLRNIEQHIRNEVVPKLEPFVT